jgi:protein transport protein SEC24
LPEELRPCNLLENRNILPSEPLTHPTISLPGDYSRYQPDPNIISSTLNVVPVTHSLLSKMKLPFGIHVHPYRQHSSKIIPILHPSVIVRCRVCRTYINPYVTFIDSRHWRCNLCFRPNDLPEDFNYNPQTGEQGRGHRKELVYTTVEYIASSEYMLRPPQPCTYFYVIDVSHNAVTSGMLATVCATLLENLDRLPGDSRTLFGLMTFDRNIHFYNMLSSLAQFQMMTVSDLDDVFLPVPGSLLVNLKENKEMIKNVLEELPKMFAQNAWIDSALGAAMSAACKILSPVGGRISVFTASTPSVGPGATKPHLTAESKSSVSKEKLKVAPATDFYKKIALECYTQQTGIDLFFFSQQPIGYASVACAAQVSSGQVYYYPGFHSNDTATRDRFVMDLIRYLTRPVGFEAVMRIRCTQGLGLHAFHGNFFVRSSDLLSLPNVSPDMGYAVNLSIDESLKDLQMVCIQTALLYTSSKGERRIRVHTIALPVSDKPADIYAGCNVQAMTGLLAKMGADKIANASLGDAREALMNAIVDCIKAYKSNMNSSGFLSLPASLRLFPLFTLALMKHPAFSLDARTTVDARADAMNTIKTLPLDALLVHIYPHLYCLNSLTEEKNMKDTKSGSLVVPERLHSTAAKLQRSGIYLVDCGSEIMIWVGQGCSPEHLQSVFGIGTYPDVDDTVHSLTPLDNPLSRIVTALIRQLKRTQTKMPRVRIVKEQSQTRYLVADRLVEDKTEGGFSYQEFLQHIQKQFKK